MISFFGDLNYLYCWKIYCCPVECAAEGYLGFCGCNILLLRFILHHRGAKFIMGIEIAFYDVETTVPFEQGQKFELLEFAAVVVTTPGLSESCCYSTLIRPSSDLMITHRSVACNGITKDALVDAPTFSQVADSIYTMLHGRVWAGHNIVRFDNMRLKEAFSQIGKPAPEAAGLIDTLPLLREKFGPRAGNMKMASLASFLGLGEQEHRSLSDVRMNLEVLKRCATLLFLESCFPKIFVDVNPAPSSSVLSMEDTVETISTNVSTSAESRSSVTKSETVLWNIKETLCKSTGFISEVTVNNIAEMKGKSRSPHSEEDITGSSSISDVCSRFNSLQLRQPNFTLVENAPHDTNSQRVLLVASTTSEHIDNSASPTTGDLDESFLEAKDVVLTSLIAEEKPSTWGGWKIVLLHQGLPLRIFECRVRVKYSLSDTYAFDSAGNPTFAIAVEPSAQACNIIHMCESLAQKHVALGGISTWRPPLLKREGLDLIRIRIKTLGSGDGAKYTTRFYKKDLTTGALVESSLGSVDAGSFRSFIQPGCLVDVGFSCNVYNFRGFAGLRFVADTIIL
ncbi:hypothetical protein O6H91_13G031100 [Diphasiastrum complanatum]|uniref:Uncharacterized protein n=1 Tax=Diphasiastrum complanatum TaxID=34168 RepID=A0ACC2BTD2_DIPCM|nr:hypothetical protein O6H91_13G031100 [Diphasiastrum complanatum]